MPFYSSNSPTTVGSNSIVWPIWVSGAGNVIGGAGGSSTTSVTGDVWPFWNGQSITTTASSVLPVWYVWNQAPVYAPGNHSPYVPPPVDPRVQAEREQRAREAAASRRRQDEEIRQQREAANARAMTLLRSVLSEGQRRDLLAHGYFFVDAPSGRRYRIDSARAGNCKVIDRVTGVWTESLCVHQAEDVPVGDTMLIQKLLIETAEEALRQTANITFRDGQVARSQGLLDRERLERQLRVASAFPEAQA